MRRGRNVGHDAFPPVGQERSPNHRSKNALKMLPEHLVIYLFLIQSIKSHQKKDDSIVIVQHIQNKGHLLTEAVKSRGSVL